MPTIQLVSNTLDHEFPLSSWSIAFVKPLPPHS